MGTLVRNAACALLPLAAACGGGGGGSSSPPITVQFAAPGSSLPEAGGAFDVTVELVLTMPALQADVTVEVYDDGTGSATPASDFALFAPQSLTFPAGSTSGTTRSVTLTPATDSLIEGPETVVLALRDATGGAALADPLAHVAAIADANEATLRFVQPASATGGERVGTHTVTVELTFAAGDVLTSPLSCDVVDALTGTATSGTDYAAFATESLSFPVTSSTVETRTVTLAVQDDVEVEGDEWVLLALQDASAGIELGTATHAVTINEDDVPEEAFLMVASGPPGLETPLANGDALDLGSQALGAGPTAGVLVHLSNLGQDPLELGAPVLVGGSPADFSVQLESSAAPPGGPSGAGGPASSASLAQAARSPFAVRADDPARGLELDLDLAALLDLQARSRVVLEGFPVPGGGTLTLELERQRAPLDARSRVHVDGAPLDDPASLIAELGIWKGRVADLAGSSAFLCLSPHGSSGWVQLDATAAGRLSLVVEEGLGDSGLPRTRLAWPEQLPGAGLATAEDLCAQALVAPGAAPPKSALEPPDTGSTIAPATCRLALETDYQLFQKLGSSAALSTYVTQLIAAVSDRYTSDVQATLFIAYLGIWTTPSDPWTTPDGPGTTLQMLDEFRDAWAPALGGSWPASGDLAHFLSGAHLGGGVAYLDVLCDQNFGFGVSANLNTAIDWDAWDGTPGSLTWDFVVVAHELGHNFSANHTHAYCPPLDSCQSTCSGPAQCSEGTLMSYCHVCPGGLGNIHLEFHPFVANAMRAAVNGSCLGEADLPGSDIASYRVRFAPTTSAGAKSTTLEFPHDATNTATPFRIALSGLATD